MDLENVAKFASLFCIDIIALTGNVVMIIIGIKFKPLRKFQNAFIFNVAVADLLQAVIIMPSSLASVVARRWLLGNRTCNAFAILKTTITLTSIFSLAGISLQRYFFVVRRVKRLDSMKYTAAAIAFVWFCSFCLSVTPLFGWGKIGYSQGRQVCTMFFHETASHTLTVFTLGLVVNVLVMIYCYASIFLTLRASRQSLLAKHRISIQKLSLKVIRYRVSSKIHDKANSEHCNGASKASAHDHQPERVCGEPTTNNYEAFDMAETEYYLPRASAAVESAREDLRSPALQPQSTNYAAAKSTGLSTINRSESKVAKKEIRLLKTIFVVVTVFIFCWLPYVVFNSLRLFRAIGENATVDTLTMWLGFLNSAANPVLYGALNTQFRQAMKQTVLLPIQQCKICSRIITKT